MKKYARKLILVMESEDLESQFGACVEGAFRFSSFGSQEDTEKEERRLAQLFAK